MKISPSVRPTNMLVLKPAFVGIAPLMRKEKISTGKDIFEPRVSFGQKTPLPKGIIARMPDGTDVTLNEEIEKTSDGLSGSQKGSFVFDDPANGRRDGKGYIEYEAIFTPEHLNLQYIWKNASSSKRNALALVVWHLTKNIQRKEFKATEIANKDIYAMGEKCTMVKDSDASMSGQFEIVKHLARQKLLKEGWTLE